MNDYIANAKAVNTESDDMFGTPPATMSDILTAQRTKAGAVRFAIQPDKALAKREYKEVVARYTNEDGTMKDGWLKAPNGKKSNLNEKQWVQVRTPSFKKWFGDWENDPTNASKVVDENGEPLVVYHGTNVEFTEFNHNKGKKYDSGFFGFGFYFTKIKIQISIY